MLLLGAPRVFGTREYVCTIYSWMEVLIFRESDERNKYTDFPSNFSKNKKFRQNT